MFLFHAVPEISNDAINLKGYYKLRGEREREKESKTHLMNRLNWVTFNTVTCAQFSLGSMWGYEVDNTDWDPWTLSIIAEAPV